MRKLNCWEFKSCKREPGGKLIGELGICPASTHKELHGMHGGHAAGRACWVVAGTFCSGVVQGTEAQTTATLSSGLAWVVNFYYGNASWIDKTTPNYVRCVRGQISIPYLTDNGNGTVTDAVTTLMWQQNNDEIGRTWEDAISYCEALTLAGYTNWRLPNLKELNSILDDQQLSPAIDITYFSN